MNLGGPDGPAAVRPFLFNLFSDKAIIQVPQPLRTLIAALISTTRAKSARANYALMGGGSPIVRETEAQAAALEAALAARTLPAETRTFLAMRYWRPLTRDAARAAAAWGATESILLPLYPQFSTTTTASSLAAWRRESALRASALCCYPQAGGFVAAHAEAILTAWREGGSPPNPRVIFSAHGLPQRVVDAGDPYQWQVEQTAAAVRARLPADWSHRIAYQSRVGPLQWLEPSTLTALDEAARDQASVIVSPIAFVSEHIETLVELDIEYAAHAKAVGISAYLRAKTLGVAAGYIDTLADAVDALLSNPVALRSADGERICPAKFSLCPLGEAP